MVRDAERVKRAKILDRIKKLLALSTSSNVNEAATAAAAAQKLMLEHRLTEVDISDTQDGQMFELPMGAAGFASRWKFALVTGVARAFFCEAVGLRVGARRKVRVVGLREDVEIASRVFKYLLREIDRLSRVELSQVAQEEQDLSLFGAAGDFRLRLRQYLDSYRRGAVAAVIEKLRCGEEEFVASDSRALVLARRDREHVRGYVAVKFPGTKAPEKEIPQIDDLAFVRGYEQAGRIAIPGAGGASPAGGDLGGVLPVRPPAPDPTMRSPVPEVGVRPPGGGAPVEVFMHSEVRPTADVIVTKEGSVQIPIPDPGTVTNQPEPMSNIESCFNRMRQWWRSKD